MIDEEKMKKHLEELGYIVIIQFDDVRIYTEKFSKALAVFNTRHGEITYTKYFNELLPFEEKSKLFVELDSFQSKYTEMFSKIKNF